MRNVALVIRHEIVTTLGKRSFWIMTILFPLAIMALNIGTQLMARNSGGGEQAAGSEGGSGQKAIGYVDHAGLIVRLPPSLPLGSVQAFADEASAQQALQSGAIASYYILPADWIQTGKVIAVEKEFNITSGPVGASVLEYVVNYNVLGDESRAALVLNPTPRLEDHALVAQTTRDESSPLTFLVPYAVMFIFFFSLTMSGGFMLQSVTKEKENRVVEVLLLSLRPREMMLGKVLGLAVVALLQMAVWLGMGGLALDQAKQLLQQAASFALPRGFFVWALLYFLLGYLLYTSMLGAIGALAPSIREGTQFTFVAMLPLMLPLFMNVAFTEAPDGPLATALSLFPLTAPTAMITRLSTGVVPFWQAALGLIGLAVTTYVFVVLSAKFFRAETLLSTSGIGWRRIVEELKR
jgi:ABC-2 type transport system permease protein